MPTVDPSRGFSLLELFMTTHVDEVAFVVMTRFNPLEDVTMFSRGPAPEVAVIEPRTTELVSRCDERATVTAPRCSRGDEIGHPGPQPAAERPCRHAGLIAIRWSGRCPRQRFVAERSTPVVQATIECSRSSSGVGGSTPISASAVRARRRIVSASPRRPCWSRVLATRR